MTARVRNRLVALGVLWGLVLATVPALAMTEPYQLTVLLVVALVCAAFSGCVGTLAVGRRAGRSAGRDARPEAVERLELLARVRIGASQGLVGGGIVALLS
jgi:hypothetical protein